MIESDLYIYTDLHPVNNDNNNFISCKLSVEKKLLEEMKPDPLHKASLPGSVQIIRKTFGSPRILVEFRGEIPRVINRQVAAIERSQCGEYHCCS